MLKTTITTLVVNPYSTGGRGVYLHTYLPTVLAQGASPKHLPSATVQVLKHNAKTLREAGYGR